MNCSERGVEKEGYGTKRLCLQKKFQSFGRLRGEAIGIQTPIQTIVLILPLNPCCYCHIRCKRGKHALILAANDEFERRSFDPHRQANPLQFQRIDSITLFQIIESK